MLTVTITAFEKSITARPDTVRSLEGFVAYLYNKHFPDIIGKRLILDRLEQKSKEEYIAHMYRMSRRFAVDHSYNRWHTLPNVGQLPTAKRRHRTAWAQDGDRWQNDCKSHDQSDHR